MNKETLMAFEQRVADAFLSKKITAPIHLSGGNEEQLIDVFKNVKRNDWVFSNWRSHYHALLKGIPERWVFDEVLAGRSMYLINKKHRFYSSSIVGGTLPVACGVAMAEKRKGGSAIVWVFVGDMTARTGIFHEFLAYCDGQRLPVCVVIEDNGLSTNTPTSEAWGNTVQCASTNVPILRYGYVRKWPHVGMGKRVAF